ncbi:MAG: hypothetical protein CMM61_03585 [Rhodospirillaceae bacterium]|nr:hypothetical protein [Rhodospirillaceae bacterium]
MTTPPAKSTGSKGGSRASRAKGAAKKSARESAKTTAADAKKDPAAPPSDTKPSTPPAGDASPAAEPSPGPSASGSSDGNAPSAFNAPPPRGAGFVRGLAWLTLVIGILGAAGAVTWPMWSDKVAEVLPFLAPAPAPEPAIDALAGRIEELEKQSDAFKQMEAERAQFQSELKVLMDRLAEVEGAVAEARALVRATDVPESKAMASESLKALSDRLEQLEQDGAQVGALSARLDQIEKGQTDLGPASDSSLAPDPQLRDTLEAMADRLRRLEQETDGAKNNAAGDAAARSLILGVAQLRDSVRGGKSFQADLESLKALAEGRPAMTQALAQLTPFAGTGVPTLAALRLRFADRAGAIVAAAGTAEGDGWIAEAAAKLSSLVTVRRVGETAEDGSVDALVARVDGLLAAGDLNGAVEALSLLKGKPADVVAPWLTAAQTRLAAEKAVANLNVHALSLLAPPKAGG